MKRYVRRGGLPRLTGSAKSKQAYNHAYYMKVTRRKTVRNRGK